MTEKRTCKERAVQAYWSVVGIAGALILSLQPVLADDICIHSSRALKNQHPSNPRTV